MGFPAGQSLGWQYCTLVAVQLLYLMFVCLTGWMALQARWRCRHARWQRAGTV